VRGSIRKRYENSWSVIVDLGYQIDPSTGLRKRRQKWVTVKGTKKQAQSKLNDLLHDLGRNEFIEPSRQTLGQWLNDWLEKAVKPPAKRFRTHETYKQVIEKVIGPSWLAAIPLQQLKAADLKRFYLELKVGPSTQAKYHAIIHSALKAAVLEGLAARNVATLVVGKPRVRLQHEDIRSQCWTAEEARAFLTVARAAGPQPAAFYTLALETGMRKAELCGLQWSDVDLETAKVQVVRQLIVPGDGPVFGPPKNGQPRTIDLGKETVQLLRSHKSHQAEIKLKNRPDYHDHDLVFAKEWSDVTRKHDVLGQPLQINNLGQREYTRLLKTANVRPIKFHGMRHTCATLLFQAGVPVKVIQERLGHKRVEITLGIYAHVLPSMQQDAAARLGVLLNA
jgi:integrase